jgi:hypothetical protein
MMIASKESVILLTRYSLVKGVNPPCSFGRTAHTMRGMGSTLLQMKRLVAMTLPACLIWALMACVFVCASHIHIEDASSGERSSFCVDASDPCGTVCCQIQANAGISRENPSVNRTNGDIESQPCKSKPIVAFTAIQSDAFSPAFSPPFRRLQALRI